MSALLAAPRQRQLPGARDVGLVLDEQEICLNALALLAVEQSPIRSRKHMRRELLVAVHENGFSGVASLPANWYVPDLPVQAHYRQARLE